MIKQFYFKLFQLYNTSFVCIRFKCQTVLFDPKIGLCQVLPHKPE